tara:strand:- start:295 stop:828 length:534 start_codon:yes stop_codon:yes gene_type:complete
MKIERTKAAEKPILKEVLRLLEEIENFPKKKKGDLSRQNVFGKQTVIEAFIMGKARSYSKKNLVPAAKNRKYPALYRALKKLMKTHNPDFKYNQIQINKNVKTAWHHDKGNKKMSYAIGLGNFTGGGIDIKIQEGNRKRIKNFDNKNRWLFYDGASNEHRTASFKGTRYAIIFYKHG